MLSQGQSIWLHPASVPCTPRIEHVFATTGGSALLRDGRVLIGYSAGRASPHALQAGESTIYRRVSADRGAVWSEERAAIHHPECKAVNPTYLRAGDGALWVFYLGFYKSAWKNGNPDWAETRSDGAHGARTRVRPGRIHALCSAATAAPRTVASRPGRNAWCSLSATTWMGRDGS